MELNVPHSAPHIVEFWQQFVTHLVELLSSRRTEDVVTIIVATSSLLYYSEPAVVYLQLGNVTSWHVWPLLLSILHHRHSVFQYWILYMSLCVIHDMVLVLQYCREVIHTLNDRVVLSIKKIGLSCHPLVSLLSLLTYGLRDIGCYGYL